MGIALQVARAFKQNITGGAFEALAAGTGDSLVVPAFEPGSSAYILEAWGATSAAAADFDIRSPSLADNIRGLRLAYQPKPAAGNVQDFLHGPVRQPLYKTDTLIAEVNGTATNNVGLNFLAYYENLSGADQKLVSFAEIEPRIVNTVGIFVNPTAGAAGDWGATRAINTDDDRLQADTEYAWLGAVSQVACESLALTGPETSNRKIGMPLLVDAWASAQWFARLSDAYKLPMIPIFNSNNKGQIMAQAADCNGATVPHVTLIFAELAS